MLIYHLAKPEYFQLKEHQSRDFENKIEIKLKIVQTLPVARLVLESENKNKIR